MVCIRFDQFVIKCIINLTSTSSSFNYSCGWAFIFADRRFFARGVLKAMTADVPPLGLSIPVDVLARTLDCGRVQ